MRLVRLSGSLPSGIAENSGPGEWTANLAISGDLLGLQSIEAIGPGGSFIAVRYTAALGQVALSPAARLDYEGFTAAGQAPDLAFSLRFIFSDGTRQDDTTLYHVAVLDRDDTPPTDLRFATGGSVTAGEIGSIIGTLAVTDPDSAGPFFFTFSDDDAWRFEVVGNSLKLRDGISLGLDEMPHRPLLVTVSDGRQSAGFTLDITVRDPAGGQAAVPILAPGEVRAGFTQTDADHVLTLQRADSVAAINLYGGDVRQVVLKSGGEVWLGPVQRLQFADGWLDFDHDGPAAQAAALHRAILGHDANGAELAEHVAQLQAGLGWADLAASLMAGAGAAGLSDADFIMALHRAASGGEADAEELTLGLGRLASGASRVQLAVDLALSPAALEHLAEASPDGLWVAQPFGGGATGSPAAGSAATSPPESGAGLDLGWLL